MIERFVALLAAWLGVFIGYRVMFAAKEEVGFIKPKLVFAEKVFFGFFPVLGLFSALQGSTFMFLLIASSSALLFKKVLVRIFVVGSVISVIALLIINVQHFLILTSSFFVYGLISGSLLFIDK